MPDITFDFIEELDEGVRALASAVAVHLAGADAAGRLSVVTRLSNLIDHEELGAEQAAMSLVEDPELLASLFQNADLLDRRSESAQHLVRVITLALEHAWER